MPLIKSPNPISSFRPFGGLLTNFVSSKTSRGDFLVERHQSTASSRNTKSRACRATAPKGVLDSLERMAAALSDGASWGPPHIAQVLTSASPPFLITGVNNAWVQLCGYTSAEAIGQTCKFLQCPETANETREALQQLHQAISEGRGVTVRLLNRKKSGERFLNELTLHVLHDPEGNPKGFRGHLVPVDMNELNSRGTSGDSVPFAPGAAAPPPLGELRTESAWPPNVQIPQQAGKAAAGKGGERGEGASGGGEAYGASSVAGSELLSRDAFPLQTLHSHPVSPVLLRLLQLNNMSSMDGRAMLSQLTSACGAGGAGLAGGAAPAWPTAHPQLPLGAMSAATVSHAQSSHAAAALQHAAVTQAAQQAFADALVSAHACPAGSWMVHPQHAAAHSAHLQAYPPSALQQSWNTAAVGYGVPPSLLSAAAAHGLWGSLPPHPHAALAQSSASYQHHQRSLGATAHAAAAHAAAAALLQPPPQLPSPPQPPLASMYSSHDRANQGNEVKLTPRLPPFPQHLAALPHLFARGRAPLHRLPEGPVSSPASTPPSRDHAAPSASAPLSCSHAPPARPSRPLFPLAPPPPTPRLPRSPISPSLSPRPSPPLPRGSPSPACRHSSRPSPAKECSPTPHSTPPSPRPRRYPGPPRRLRLLPRGTRRAAAMAMYETALATTPVPLTSRTANRAHRQVGPAAERPPRHASAHAKRRKRVTGTPRRSSLR